LSSKGQGSMPPTTVPHPVRTGLQPKAANPKKAQNLPPPKRNPNQASNSTQCTRSKKRAAEGSLFCWKFPPIGCFSFHKIVMPHTPSYIRARLFHGKNHRVMIYYACEPAHRTTRPPAYHPDCHHPRHDSMLLHWRCGRHGRP